MAALTENYVRLNNGSSMMPLLGLGCSRSQPGIIDKAVEVALDIGYRLIDSAYEYLNEEAVGKGIQNWINKNTSNKREDIFVVTKLPGIGMNVGSVKKFLKLSLKNLSLDYVDLYLVHTTVGFKYHDDDNVYPKTENGVLDIDMGTDLIAIWKEMENMVSDGLTKAIGISNFNIMQTTKILAIARIPPAVNQMASLKNNCAVLNNGLLMPLLGLGCWQEKPVPGKVEIAVKHALNSGYRHLDTAYRYQNETEVGKGIQNWVDENVNNKREDVFVVTKLSSIGMYKEGIRKFLKLSLQNLNLTYVDLYLIHMPIGMHYKKDDDTMPVTSDGSFDIDLGTDLIAIWKEMEKMVDEGLTKSIGISNFSIKQMRKLLAISRIPPAVNQIEMHVGFQQKELVEFCRATNIVVTAYSPLGSPGRDIMQPILGITLKSDPILTNPIVKLVAANHNVTTAQILIKFIIQRGIVAIPKSIDPDRIKSNGDVFSFTLTNTEMDALKLLDKGEKGRGVDFSKFPGLSDHPECPQ